jgi:hypothetical protein
MTAVPTDLALVADLAVKATLATLLRSRGHGGQLLAGDHAVVALRPVPAGRHRSTSTRRTATEASGSANGTRIRDAPRRPSKVATYRCLLSDTDSDFDAFQVSLEVRLVHHRCSSNICYNFT